MLLVSKAMTVAGTHGKAALLAEQCDLTLVTPTSWPSYAAEHPPAPGSFRWVRLPVSLPGWNHFHFYRGAAAALRGYRPDLVHIDEEPWSLVTWQWLRMAQRWGSPAVLFTWQNIDKRYPPPFDAIERRSHRHAAAIIAGNAEAATLLRCRGFAGSVATIPQFGVERTLFATRAADRPALGLPARALVVGYAGRLVPEKGLDTLLAAAARRPGVHVAIVGGGPLERELRQLATTLGIEGRTTFLGGVPSQDVARVIAALDVLVLPSRTTRRWKEQFGRVLTEAMACGVPVVGSDSGEIPHVIGDAGLVFPEGDSEALAACLARLDSAEARREYAARGLARVRAHYTQEHVAAATLAVWRDAMSRRGSP